MVETMENREFYLHGKTLYPNGRTDTLWTRQVKAKHAPLPHHLAGLQYTATGYGSAIPTEYMVMFNGRWRRVYCCIYSNSGTLYLKPGRHQGQYEQITVQVYG